jgi:hypothetical protein
MCAALFAAVLGADCSICDPQAAMHTVARKCGLHSPFGVRQHCVHIINTYKCIGAQLHCQISYQLVVICAAANWQCTYVSCFTESMMSCAQDMLVQLRPYAWDCVYTEPGALRKLRSHMQT